MNASDDSNQKSRDMHRGVLKSKPPGTERPAKVGVWRPQGVWDKITKSTLIYRLSWRLVTASESLTRYFLLSRISDLKEGAMQLLSFFRKKLENYENIAIENAEAYEALFSHMKDAFSKVDSEMREILAKVTMSNAAKNLEWRFQHTYDVQMNHVLGNQYRQEAEHLKRRAHNLEKKSGGKGLDSFCNYAGDLLASFYLIAESLCFEFPYTIDIVQQELLGQQKILRDLNSMLREYDLHYAARVERH